MKPCALGVKDVVQPRIPFRNWFPLEFNPWHLELQTLISEDTTTSDKFMSSGIQEYARSPQVPTHCEEILHMRAGAWTTRSACRCIISGTCRKMFLFSKALGVKFCTSSYAVRTIDRIYFAEMRDSDFEQQVQQVQCINLSCQN